MEIRPSFLIPTMLKAMTDTVLPAVDPENKLALEQARLVIGMLHLISGRLPLLYRYDRTELRHYVDLAKRLTAESRGGSRTVAAARELSSAANEGAGALERVGADPVDLESRLLDLREKVGALVQCLNEDGDAESRQMVRRIVIAASRSEIERARAWILPQGWEADPASLPTIESLLSKESA
jgi:hypothetical protein